MIDQRALADVLAIILPVIKEHRRQSSKPFVLGLSGLQGSGKSTWAAALSTSLSEQYGLNTRPLSVDDLYRDHSDLVGLSESHPDNKLLRTRGQPGTHDEDLAKRFFSELFNEDAQPQASSIAWPSYDKSLNQGRGGRVPLDQWEKVSLQPLIDVLIFEGWCLGFQPLSPDAVTAKWHDAVQRSQSRSPETFSTTTLADHKLEHLLLINENLSRYCDSFIGPWRFDAFLHLSTDKLANVYTWRLDQEQALRKVKSGMSDEQVIEFVKGYMPSYELFLEHLQSHSLFEDEAESRQRKKHVQVTLDDKRFVTKIKEL